MRRLHLYAFALAASVAVLSPVACGTSSSSAGPTPDAGSGADGTGGAETSTPAPDSAADAPADTPADVDNGAPSTSYPAPHPPLPQLVNNARRARAHGAEGLPRLLPGVPRTVAQLQDFAQKLVAVDVLGHDDHTEYGVGALTYGGTIDADRAQTPPTTISSTDIQTWVAARSRRGPSARPTRRPSTRSSTRRARPSRSPTPSARCSAPPQSCVAFGGYHDNATLTPDDGGAAELRLRRHPDVLERVLRSTISPRVVSHEWVEASTDPYLTSSGAFTLTGGPDAAFYSADPDHIIWDLLGGGEAGDHVRARGPGRRTSRRPTSGTRCSAPGRTPPRQASHDPCVPERRRRLLRLRPRDAGDGDVHVVHHRHA